MTLVHITSNRKMLLNADDMILRGIYFDNSEL